MRADAALPLLNATQLAASLQDREVSSVEVVNAALALIDDRNPLLNAFLAIPAERALEEAETADRLALSSDDLPALHGLPVAIKDLQRTEGVVTTFGSLAYADYVPSRDCAAVARLREAGAIVVGKTNTPFFGLLGETKNRLGPDCRNPWNLERTPGGSSGGSAAALAAGLVALATGTDAAGSITAPAGFSGVYGLKPTHGRISNWPPPRDSLLLLDSGPMTRSVGDAALMLSVMAGFDSRDPMSLREHVSDFQSAARAGSEEVVPLAGLRVAYSSDLGHFRVNADVRDITLRTAKRFEELGARVSEVTPRFDDPFEIYMPLYITDLRLTLGDRFDDFAPDLCPETESELAENPPLSAEGYVRLLNRLWHFRSSAADFFDEFDLLLTPTTATTAFPIGRPPEELDGHPVRPSWTTFMPFEVAWNLTGQPVASVPCGVSNEGLPVGLLVVGSLGQEVNVIRASAALERAEPWQAMRVPSATSGPRPQ